MLYKGKSIKGVRAHKIVESGLAQVPEGRHVFLHMTVDENLDMGAYTQPASTIAANKEKVFTLFPRLKERRKQLAGTMSGGEQQMLAMGRALMSNASMLMLDEPSMGLSPLLVQEIFDIIRNIHKEGMTILLVEQNATHGGDRSSASGAEQPPNHGSSWWRKGTGPDPAGCP